MAEDETAEVLQSVHTALTILQDNSGLQQSEAKKNLKEELARDERKVLVCIYIACVSERERGRERECVSQYTRATVLR